MKTKPVLSSPKKKFLSVIIRMNGSFVPTIVLIILLSLNFCLLSSQVPQGFTYQAIARDGSGNPIANATIKVKLSVLSDTTGFYATGGSNDSYIWEEEQTNVQTNAFGLFTLVFGNPLATKILGTATSFSTIDWTKSPLFIGTKIANPTDYKIMGSAQLWSVPYSMVAKDLSGAVKKLSVEGETSDMEEALFEVKNKKGQTVFAVYNEGVRIYVDDGKAKGATKGGFAIGGFDMGKSPGQEYLRVTRDSTRIYVNDSISKGATKGGFAIGGFSTAKSLGQEYLRVTPDSTRIYVNDNITKGATKGGFAIGGFANVKAQNEEYLRVTSDSVKVSKSLLIPRLTSYERDHLSFIPGEALIIFNITEGCMQIFKNNVWSNIWCFNCAPAFLIQPVDNIICSGNMVNFFVSATGTSLSYQWQQSSDNGTSWYNIYNGGSSPVYSGCNYYTLTLTNIPVSHHNFKYRCIVSGSCLPDVTSNAVTLNVGSTPPVIVSQPSNQQLSGSCTATFNIVSPGYSVSYKWQQSVDEGTIWTNISNGGTSPAFSGAAAATLSLSNVPWSSNNFKYRCIVSNLCGADATSDAATLIIVPSSIVTQPSNQQLSDGCDANFSIAASAGYVVSYQWQASSDGGSTWNNISNGGTSPLYSGVTASSLSLSNVPLAFSNYQYRCIVSSLCGPNETSNSATLNVDASPVITVQPVNRLVYNGGNIDFNITTAGIGFNYRWQVSPDGGDNWSDVTDGGSNPAYSGANTPGLSLTNIPLAYDNYKYRCFVSHYCRSEAISDAVTLSVPTPTTVTDIDGNTYNTVGINTQLWMAENLKTTKYNNGDLIGTSTPVSLDLTNEDSPKYQWAYEGNESNVNTYGRLYTWYAITDSRKLCPAGWHVSTEAEWEALSDFLGGYENAGTKLKEAGTTHWAPPSSGATNETGFTALPGGWRDIWGNFGQLTINTFLWTSTEVSFLCAYFKGMSFNTTYLATYGHYSKHYGFSVRCVKDPAK